MPIRKIERLNDHRHWGLWEITEGLDTLLKKINLSDEEQGELDSIGHSQKKIEWLTGRMTVRALAEEKGIGYTGIKKDIFGKPHLSGEQAEISLSHSYPIVTAIISSKGPVGIDVEQPKKKLARISHKFLSLREKEHTGEDLHKLCLYWSAKEALYKIYGKKQLTFRENIEIVPFEIAQEGQIKGKIHTDNYEATYLLQYYLINGFFVVFNVWPLQ